MTENKRDTDMVSDLVFGFLIVVLCLAALAGLVTGCGPRIPDLAKACVTQEQKEAFRKAYLDCGKAHSIYDCQVDAARLICEGEYR